MIRFLIVIGLLVGVLATVSQAALPPFNTTRLYSEAAFIAATKPYTEAIAANANDADAHYWLGMAYLNGARMFRFGFAPYGRDFAPKAIASLERAIQLRPASLRAYISLIEAYSVAGDRDQVRATLDRMMTVGRPAPVGSSK